MVCGLRFALLFDGGDQVFINALTATMPAGLRPIDSQSLGELGGVFQGRAPPIRLGQRGHDVVLLGGNAGLPRGDGGSTAEVGALGELQEVAEVLEAGPLLFSALNEALRGIVP